MMIEARPNFTGIWRLDLKRTTLQIAPPTATTFQIQHEEPHFQLSRTHVYGETSDTWSIALATDGTEHCQKNGDLEVRAQLSWTGSSLEANLKFNRKGDEGIVNVRYTVSDSGQTLTAVELLRSSAQSYDNTWVFERQ
jgi:hypothetical protein